MSDNQKAIAWDVVRACFYLLAGIIWAQIAMAFAIWASCAYGILIDKYPVGSCKEVAPNMMELMVGGMAVVIAFSNGRAAPTPSSKKPDYDENDPDGV